MLLADAVQSQGLAAMDCGPLFTDSDQQDVLQSASLSLRTSGVNSALEQQATADAEAVVVVGTDCRKSWTARQLITSSSRCTAVLRAHNVGPESLTAMHLSGPGFAAAVGLLAILRTGSIAAFLPTSTAYRKLQGPDNVAALNFTDDASKVAISSCDSELEVCHIFNIDAPMLFVPDRPAVQVFSSTTYFGLLSSSVCYVCSRTTGLQLTSGTHKLTKLP